MRPFVESTFKLRVQTRVAHSGAEIPPLSELFSHRKSHCHGALMPLRLIEVWYAPLVGCIVVQHAVELCPFERVEQRFGWLQDSPKVPATNVFCVSLLRLA